MRTQPPRPNADEARKVFDLWKHEDHYLATQLDQLRDWMMQVSQLGIPRFGETAGRLRRLKTCLVSHFGREELLCNQLAELYGHPSPEIEAIRRQADRDHQQLLQRIDRLIEELSAVDPGFRSWRDAMDQVDWFMDSFEEHEQQEAGRIRAMIPEGRA